MHALEQATYSLDRKAFQELSTSCQTAKRALNQTNPAKSSWKSMHDGDRHHDRATCGSDLVLDRNIPHPFRSYRYQHHKQKNLNTSQRTGSSVDS